MPADEPLRLQPFVFRFVLDPLQGFGRRSIVRQFEDAAEQDRDVTEFGAATRLDCGDRAVREVGIGAAEIEMEFD